MNHDDSLPNLDPRLLQDICGGATSCTTSDPVGRSTGTSMTSWSGRTCDGPRTTMEKNASLAHRIPDMMDGVIGRDVEKFNDAYTRQAPVPCRPGDVASTP